jgi:hypothetical protein
MGRSGKTSLFDRKLEELQQERERVEDTIKSLSKAIRKIESASELPPAAPSRAPAMPRIARTTVSPAAAVRAQETLERVFGTSADTSPAPSAPAAPEGDLLPGFSPPPAVGGKKPISDAGKFAAYLASGSFGKAPPLAKEKRIQRNKAIFMVLFVLIAAYVLYRMIS